METLDKSKLQKNRAKQRWSILTSTICEIIIAPYIAYIIHQYFDWIMHLSNLQLKLDYNYVNAIKMLFANYGVRIWFFLIQVLYVFFITWLMLRPKATISNTRTISITDKVTIPISVGNGQYGSERFLTEKEKADIYSTFVFTGKEVLKAKGGLVIEMEKKGSMEIIKYIGDDIHCLIIGATGSGKTRRVLLQTLWLQMLSNLCAVISDVKGEIYHYTHKFAESLGYRTIAIDLRYPKKSHHYNFLQPILDALNEGDKAKAIDYTWDLVLVLVGEPKGEPLWYNGETATLAAAILAVSIEADSQYKNMANVYYFLAYMCQTNPETGITPLSLYLDTLDDRHPAKTVFAMAQVAAQRTRSSFFTSALGTLRLFTNPNVAEMTSKSDFRLEEIGSEKTIVYLMIPDEKKTLYPLASILIQQIYITQVELANKNGLRLPIDTDYDLDEVGNFPTIPILGDLLSAGRSRGCRANLVIQDYQQLESKYKHDFETIKSCCRAKIYLKSDNTKTLQEISKTLGNYTVETTSASTSASTSQKNNDVNLSNSSNMTGRNLLMPSEISHIDYPYALCMLTGNYSCITKMPDLSKYKINQIWGLGNEGHNTKLIAESEKEREERTISNIPLWGIWNQFLSETDLPNEANFSFLD